MTPPTTNRSRVESTDHPIYSAPLNSEAGQAVAELGSSAPVPRRRRVSDGSTAGTLRKDMLLQRMAEALQMERSKSLVFQKELQNAEHEVSLLSPHLSSTHHTHPDS